MHEPPVIERNINVTLEVQNESPLVASISIEIEPTNGQRGDLESAVHASSGTDAHGHSVQFYGDDAFLLDDMCLFFQTALGAGDAAVVIATREHQEGLVARLASRGLDVDRAVDEGRLLLVDATEALQRCVRNGRPVRDRFEEFIGGAIGQAAARATGARPRVAVFGEIVALLCADDNFEAAVAVEELWNDLARRQPFYLHCAYPMHVFGGEEGGERIRKICAFHSRVTPTESYTALTCDDDRLRTITLLQQKAQALAAEIDERKRMERLLLERNEELKAAIAARDAFLSVAAHELKTPVTSLRAFAQLLLRDARRKGEIAHERLVAGLTTIDQQSGKLNHLMMRLLDVAQIEAGRLRIERTTADVGAIVRSAIGQMRSRETHTFVLDLPEHIEALVDPIRFEQVITNLLDNAVKFSPVGSTVTIELRHDDGGGFELGITDQGVGVSPHQREAVFNRFHQAHGDSHVPGMGLGLYISRQIMELHGGTVRIEEPELPGTRFVVCLPGGAEMKEIGAAA